MNVTEFLSTLQNAANVSVVLRDLESGATIAELKTDGYASLDDTIEAREINRWNIISATKIEVVLSAASGTGTP